MTDSARPLLAITMGDPAGIGPEIVLKALAHADVFALPAAPDWRPAHLGAGRGLAWADPEFDVVTDLPKGSTDRDR